MKAKARPAKPAAAPQPKQTFWPYVQGGAALLLLLWIYSPAMHGPFLFDDAVFTLPGLSAPLLTWIRGGVRPALYFTYWVNAHFWRDDPYGYHVFNVFFHGITCVLVYLIVRRLAEWAGLTSTARAILPVFAAALFLAHPAQSEAVAYLAGRSDSFSALLVFSAFTVFLYRKERAITWGVAAAVLLLFGLALLSKEQAIALLGLLVLTDFWWNPGFSFEGLGKNWKLYLPMALGAAGGVALFWNLITKATTAGFGLKDFTWYQYFFTQCRALFVYIGLFLLPVRLTLDWDFPISKNIVDHGAIVGMLALIALAAAAWHYRRRFRLASYGFFVYLILMAPTSSILPIQDPIAERRLYSSMLGLLLIVVDLVSRLKVSRNALAGGCAAVVLLAAAAAHARAALWADPIALFQDTVSKSPNKARPHFHLAMSYFDTGRYDLAIPEFRRTAELERPDYNLLVDWGLAYDAMGRSDEALAKLRQAALLDPTAHIYTQIALVYAKGSHWPEAMEALNAAQRADGSFAPTYVYRGNIYFNTQQFPAAIAEYQQALHFQPDNAEALQNLERAKQMLRIGR